MAIGTIMIIDDERNIVRALERELEEEDYEILSCNSAEDAVSLLQERDIGLIMCDYKLRGMNGIDFLASVRKEYPEIITILLTGHADLDLAVDAINRTGIYKFIVKPWDNEELKETIRTAFTERHPQRLRGIVVGDIMSKFGVTISEDALLLDAAHLMMRFRISGLPVVSRQGAIVGIITATDLFRVMGESVVDGEFPNYKNKDIEQVKDVMTHNVVTVDRKTPLASAISAMYSQHIHTLPVVEGGELVGVLGRRDVLYSFFDAMQKGSV